MSEKNDTGNEPEPRDEAVETETTPAVPDEATPQEPAADSGSKLPSWITRTRLIATGAAAAIFLGGGAAGYAVGKDDHGRIPDRFDRAGFGPGQGPDGQFPGGQGPGSQQGQAPQSQSQS